MDFSFDKLGGSGEPDILSSGNKIEIDKNLKSQGHGGDHSPTKLIDISDDGTKLHQYQQQQQHDDFEHVFHTDPFGNDSSNVDFLQNLEPNFNKKINQTIDFMNAEKSDFNNIIQPQPVAATTTMKTSVTAAVHPSAPPPPPPTRKAPEPEIVSSAAAAVDETLHDAFESIPNPSSAGYYESDYQKEHYSASPVKKIIKDENDEKFISSEDLLGDFKDERMRTPEPSFKPQEDINVQPQQPSGVNDSHTFSSTASGKSSEILTVLAAPQPPPQTTKSSISNENTVVAADKKKKENEPASFKKQQKMTSAEEIFFKFGLDTWFKPETLHPKVESLIYWRDVKKSGIVFGAGLLTLLAISCFSVISVFAYISLLVLAGTIAFRIYKTVMGAVQKTSEGHPFKEYLEVDLNLPHEKVQQIVNLSVAHVNGFASELRRLFLVEDLVDSIKFGVILWVLTYVGAWFNGMTLVILAFVSLFTLPKVYENNKQSIDTYLDLVRIKILEITDKVKAAIPIGKKPESDKDK